MANFEIEKIDKFTFLGAISVILVVITPILIWPIKSAKLIHYLKDVMTNSLGILYLATGLFGLVFMLYIYFSSIGKIKLGDSTEKPEYSTFSWVAMLFCGGIGASILYWGMIEWAFYYKSPPFGGKSGSIESIKWATAYGIFHWGPIAWSIYLIPSIPIAYFFYVRKQPVLKISMALKPVLGERGSNCIIGKCLDIFFIFGLLGGAATTLGLAAPMINTGLNKLFNIPITPTIEVIILLFCTLLFSYSSYKGIDKGIKVFSNINFLMAIVLLAFILFVGPSLFILEAGFEAIGTLLSNFFTMATWLDAVGGQHTFQDSRFPQNWTVFYWAWWLVFAPSMGLFIARISRGRTIRQMIAGSILYGSLGCALHFIIMGNYGLSLQLSGQLNVIELIDLKGPNEAIFTILEQLPLNKIVIFCFVLLSIIFTATTFDSIAFILAAVVQNDVSEDPMRWNRLFWALLLALLPSVLLFIGDLNTLQTAAIIGGIPLLFISAMLMFSGFRAATTDLCLQESYSDDIINIAHLPEFDPWSIEGVALANFERLKNTAIISSRREKDSLNSLWDARNYSRNCYLKHPQTDHSQCKCQKRLKQCLLHWNLSRKQKLHASLAVKQARKRLNTVLGSTATQ
ncbi:BCCT family transporter [Photobacterium damselae subsp. damselae]|uniref:BCCT family transporter n=1 Tax=Photobacterium damselae TaxID=38293 RepID=UPI0015F49E11|nr:BCCT family transporter [Photobacterium damselae]MBA5684408.1 BCCT family transporter [Photobacterium damselae subsp. damselae]